MRRILALAAALSVLALTGSAGAQQPTQVSPKLKDTLDHMKEYAATKQGLISRTPQGTVYYKWIQSPPPGFEKAYFQLIELNVGKKFLCLKLLRKTPGGDEVTVLNDNNMSSTVEEAYRATGRTYADADRAIQISQDKLKIAITPEMNATWAAMLEELKWELRSN